MKKRTKYKDWLVLAHSYAYGMTPHQICQNEDAIDGYLPRDYEDSLSFRRDTPFEAVWARFIPLVVGPVHNAPDEHEPITHVEMETELRWHRYAYKLYKRWYTFHPEE